MEINEGYTMSQVNQSLKKTEECNHSCWRRHHCHSGEVWCRISTKTSTVSFHIPDSSFLTDHSVIRCCTVRVTDSVVKQTKESKTLPNWKLCPEGDPGLDITGLTIQLCRVRVIFVKLPVRQPAEKSPAYHSARTIITTFDVRKSVHHHTIQIN